MNNALTQIKLLKELINAFKHKTLYIFGAGASYGYLPPKYEIYDTAKKELSQHISGVTISQLPILRPEELDRFQINIGQHTIHPTPEGELLIDDTYFDLTALAIRTHPEILELIALLSYSLEKHPIFCPEYQIFNCTNTKSIFLNLNHDHLAEQFIKNRKLISLHGTLSPEVRKMIVDLMPLLLAQEIHGASIKRIIGDKFYLVTKEYEHLLLHTPEYVTLQNELVINDFFSIIIIGYSFFKKDGSNIYDGVTYDLIRSYVYEHKKCKVIVIDPEPEFVADMLNKSLSNIKISMYKTFWNCFTKALVSMLKYRQSSCCQFSQTDLKIFTDLYDAFLDESKPKNSD